MSKQREALQKAYRAIHSMLEAGEWYEPRNVLNQIEEALAEPEQEPAAWISCSPTRGNGRQLHWTRQDAWRWSSDIVPLYTTPPIRKSLTDEEITALTPNIDAWKYEIGFESIIEFARVIERAHKIGDAP